MSELSTREAMKERVEFLRNGKYHFGDVPEDAIAVAYADGELLTRAEWEASRGWSQSQATKAADAFNAEMVRITGKSSAVEMRAIYAVLNAALDIEEDS